jgi:hypothetical protein
MKEFEDSYSAHQLCLFIHQRMKMTDGKRSDGLWPGELIKDGSFSGNMHSIYAA